VLEFKDIRKFKKFSKSTSFGDFSAFNTTSANFSRAHGTFLVNDANFLEIWEKFSFGFSGDLQSNTTFSNGDTSGRVGSSSYWAFVAYFTFSCHDTALKKWARQNN
jgi:hypothetical protein